MTNNRFLKIPTWVWDGVSGLAGAIGISALLGGGVFAVLEYQDRRAASRAAETLNLIDIWEVRGAQQAFQDIAVVLENAVGQAGPEANMTDDEVERFRQNLVRRVMLDPGPEAYEKVVNYFTRLSLCIQADLCSEEIADVFFSETVKDFTEWFAPEINKRRRFDPQHARELDWLVCRFDPPVRGSSPRNASSCKE